MHHLAQFLQRQPTPNRPIAFMKKTSLSWDSSPACMDRVPSLYHFRHHHCQAGPKCKKMVGREKNRIFKNLGFPAILIRAKKVYRVSLKLQKVQKNLTLTRFCHLLHLGLFAFSSLSFSNSKHFQHLQNIFFLGGGGGNQQYCTFSREQGPAQGHTSEMQRQRERRLEKGSVRHWVSTGQSCTASKYLEKPQGLSLILKGRKTLLRVVHKQGSTGQDFFKKLA